MPTQARSIASLTISFGLVAIPVKLYSATPLGAHLLQPAAQKDGSRLKQQYIAVTDGKPVERDEMVKGYEFAKDQYVIFTAEEIKALEEAGTHSIDIAEFVPIESVDPVYFDKTYYLAPDKGGAKPYALLTTALRKAEPLRGGPLGVARQGAHRRDPADWRTGSPCSSCTSRRRCATSRI